MRVVVADNYMIYLGRQGENRVTQVRFPYVAEWAELYGAGTFEVQTRRPGEAVAWTVQESRIVGDSVVWDVTAADTAFSGTGYCQLRYTVGSALAKSQTWATRITESLSGSSSDPPEAWQSWVDQVLQAGNMVSEAAQAAVESAENAEASETHAAQSEENAEAWAVGQRGGQDVLTNDPTYQNNAKYYAEQVADPAAASAEADALKAEGYAVGKQNGTDVPSGTYYHNNAKYYADRASLDQIQAGGYKSEAREYRYEAEAWAVGTIGGASVPTTDEQHENNAKYYAEAAAASAEAAADAAANAGYAVNLRTDEIPDTVQSYTFTDGAVTLVQHKRGNTVIRSDAFSYGDGTITETRTLNTGETLTIVTNLTTLETTVTYAAA